jgi:hypothetical protein
MRIAGGKDCQLISHPRCANNLACLVGHKANYLSPAHRSAAVAGKQAGQLVFATDPPASKSLFGLHPNATHRKSTYEI